LGAVAALGVLALLPAVPRLPAMGLRQRLAPLGDVRVASVLLTTLLAMSGALTLYTYVSLVYDRATGRSGTMLAVLLFAFGAGAIVGNFGAGGLTDRIGSRSVVNLALVIGAINAALLPVSSSYFASALVAITLSGACGYAVSVPQQHRLIGISPSSAPLVIALNASAVYAGVALSGPIGAAGVGLLGAHQLGLLTTGLLALGLLASEIARRFSSPGKAPGTPLPMPAAKTESSTTAKPEGAAPPTSREVVQVHLAHREDSTDQHGGAAR
jgi:MFS transporter, DHA1 family, inner membrane transport protein